MKRTTGLQLGILLTSLALGVAASAGPPSAHDTVACRGCHDSGVAAQGMAGRTLADRCRDCHAAKDLATAAQFHDARSGDCLDCHSFHEADRVATASGELSLKELGTIDSAHCRSCHVAKGSLGNLSPAHQAAAFLYHFEAGSLAGVSPSEACLRCHANDSDSSWAVYHDESLLFSRHASHPYGVAVTAGAGGAGMPIRTTLDPRIPLFDGRIECQSCHRLTVDQDDLLIRFPAKYDLCLGCHRDAVPDGERRTPPVALAGFGP